MLARAGLVTRTCSVVLLLAIVALMATHTETLQGAPAEAASAPTASASAVRTTPAVTRAAKRTAARLARAREARARASAARASARMQARCIATARTRSQKTRCKAIKLSTSIRRLSSQSNRHEVVCHRTGSRWVAIPPDQRSSHSEGPGHEGDFVIFADYPDSAKWSDLKRALDEKCGCEQAKPRVKPAAPTYVDVCGTAKDTYTIPSQDGVVYYVNGAKVPAGTYAGSGTVKIMAKAKKKGTVLAGTSAWTFTFTDEPCNSAIVVTPTAPTIAPVCGQNNDVVSTPTVTGLTYTVGTWQDNRLVVTVTANPGYAIADGAPTKWVFRDDCTVCPPVPTKVTPAAPTVTEVCGPNNDTVVTPQTPGVRYEVGTWVDNKLTVTATALPGYELTGQTTWTFTDAAVPCPVLPAPVVSPPTAPIVETPQVVPTQLAIAKRAPAASSAKKAVTFTITVTNTGTAVAHDVVVNDFIPVGMALVSKPAGATLVNGVVQWKVGDLAPGASASVSVAMRLATNRTTVRCNTSTTVGSNAALVIGRACTRFARVAGVRRLPVAG